MGMEPSLATLASELSGLESAKQLIQSRVEYITAQLAGTSSAKKTTSKAKLQALQRAREALAKKRKQHMTGNMTKKKPPA
jgi:hypothetical protein